MNVPLFSARYFFEKMDGSRKVQHCFFDKVAVCWRISPTKGKRKSPASEKHEG
jgi:hypothetical protein